MGINWYSKPLEWFTFFYFKYFLTNFSNAYYFELFTILLCYAPIVIMLYLCKDLVLWSMGLLAFCVLNDPGHSLQFFRFYLALNVMLVLTLVNYKYRILVISFPMMVHQSVGVIYVLISLFSYIIKLSAWQCMVIIFFILCLSIRYTGELTDVGVMLHHSFSIMDNDIYYANLNTLLIPKLIVLFAFQICVVIVFQEINFYLMLSVISMCIVTVMLGILGELLFRVNCYVIEILFPMHVLLSRKKIKYGT